MNGEKKEESDRDTDLCYPQVKHEMSPMEVAKLLPCKPPKIDVPDIDQSESPTSVDRCRGLRF